LTQGRLTCAPLIEKASWYCDALPMLKKHIDFPEDSHTSANDFLYNLKYANPRPHFLRRESQAREQVTLDLALSSHIFSPQPFVKAPYLDTDVLEAMSRAAEALSLSDEPPAVQFGYLHPIPRQDEEDLGKSLPERLTSPLGVRLLLKEWEIGADPLDYAYQDPYNGSFQQNPTSTSSTQGTTSRMTQTNSRLPPPVVASNTFQPTVVQTESATRWPFVAQSQGSMPRADLHLGAESGSQPYMTSTQILAGPYGGRLTTAKKKQAKKRVGGF